MANLKITELPEQLVSPAADDLFVTVDISEPQPVNQTKKIRSDKLYVHAAAQLAANVVETAKIKDGAVLAAKLGTGAVETAKIADGAIVASKITDTAVITSKLADGAVTTQKIATQAVNAAKIAPGSAGQTLMVNASGNTAWQTQIVVSRYTSTSWDGDAKNIGTYDLNLNTVFGVPTGVKVVFVKASAKWAAASDGSFMEIFYGVNFRGLLMRALVANMNIDAYGPILVPSNGVIRVEVGGANALSVILEIEGYSL